MKKTIAVLLYAVAVAVWVLLIGAAPGDAAMNLDTLPAGAVGAAWQDLGNGGIRVVLMPSYVARYLKPDDPEIKAHDYYVLAVKDDLQRATMFAVTVTSGIGRQVDTVAYKRVAAQGGWSNATFQLPAGEPVTSIVVQAVQQVEQAAAGFGIVEAAGGQAGAASGGRQ